MKKLVLILSIVTAVAFAGMVFAQGTTPPEKQTPEKQMPQKQAPAYKEKMPEKSMPEKKMKETKMMGMVASVDAVANTLVVKHKKSEITFHSMPMTKITIAGKEAKFADLKKDSKVTVTYKWEGKKRVATAIIGA